MIGSSLQKTVAGAHGPGAGAVAGQKLHVKEVRLAHTRSWKQEHTGTDKRQCVHSCDATSWESTHGSGDMEHCTAPR